MADNLTCLVVTKDSEKDNVQINSDKYNFQLKKNIKLTLHWSRQGVINIQG